MTEVLHHRDGLALFALLKAARLWAHIPTHRGHLVRLMVTIARHNNGMLELVVHCFMNLMLLGGFSSKALLLVSEAVHLLINKLQAIVD